MSQARRIALRAQGLAAPRPVRAGPAGMRGLQQVVDRLGLLQIDSVNVLARAHLMPTWSRLGAYDTSLLERAAGTAPRRLVEGWAHEASYVPPWTYRLLEWRRAAWLAKYGDRRAEPAVADVLALVAEHGPVTAAQVHDLTGGPARSGAKEWGWNWTAAKRALEHLFFVGELTSAGRTGAFERRYELTSRVLPPDVLARPQPSEADAVRELVEISARAHGIGTVSCFADYFRMAIGRAAPAVAELVESGLLVPVAVDGWGRPTYRHRDATLPRRASGATLLSPFDPLVFERRRLEELFGLRYRIEIYVPQEQRVWGYYALPFLVGESLCALVDLKADRRAGVLRVQAVHRAPVSRVALPVPDATVVAALALELEAMAAWLGLDEVVVGTVDGVLRGDLAVGLDAVVGLVA
ncbi:DNA glycosylase AlkZ-like family protein [Cellulomonas sp. HZM]|uniref:winged helix-turn-helix domain-containing protein n=1 Tax=Cellulomonas sp. HZM TaxID=1454010 RepID=UPI00068BA3DE